MIRRSAWLLMIAACAPLLLHAATPTALRVVDLRWARTTPETRTWVGALQGMVNRKPDSVPVFVIDSAPDAMMADELVRVYGLKRDVLTPEALLAAVKPTLVGQVVYDPELPWTRNIALTAVGVSAQPLVALPAREMDLDLEIKLDLRAMGDEMKDRMRAYAWLETTYIDQVDKSAYVLAPESGHHLADFIVSRKLLAVDYAPTNTDETIALQGLAKRYPAGTRVVGCADERCLDLAKGVDAGSILQKLTQALSETGHVIVPARAMPNLSCYARFPATRPLIQGRQALPFDERRKMLAIVYDPTPPAIQSSSLLDDARSLDSALWRIAPLLDSGALMDLPVDVQVPLPLREFAPALYQFIIARQRWAGVELIAAPNGDGWARPRLLQDRSPYMMSTATKGVATDLRILALNDVGEQREYQKLVLDLNDKGWRGTVLRPEELFQSDRTPRGGVSLPGFAGAVATLRVRGMADLRTALAANRTSPLVVVYADPASFPPEAVRALLPEIEGRTIVTLGQAYRAVEEIIAVQAWFRQQETSGEKTPKRTQATLTVSAPTATGPFSPDKPIEVSVKTAGMNEVLTAELTYTAWNGRVGVVELRNTGGGLLRGTLPPTMSGGTVTVAARIVEKGGCAVTYSPSVALKIPSTDTDQDGADDVLEAYLGSDATRRDTDADGLPDGLDPMPRQPDADVTLYSAPVVPPLDKPFLADPGASTADGNGRAIPATGTVTYRLPTTGLPAANGAVRIVARGTGSVTLNGVATAIAANGEGTVVLALPLTPAQMTKGPVTLTFTAGDAGMTVVSLAITSPRDGPYITAVDVSPEHPAANVPLRVLVKVHSPRGIAGVKLRYGPVVDTLATVPMTAVPNTGNVVFTCELPAQISGAVVLNAEATDREGQVCASPFRVVTVGRPRRHTLSLLGGRELQGDWNTSPIWGGLGRATAINATDAGRMPGRPGRYVVWVLAQPRERGVAVTVEHKPKGEKATTLLARGVKGGMVDGWYRLGSFDLAIPTYLGVSVTPLPGERGTAAYGMVLITQDDGFQPPTPYAGVDWLNTLTVQGLAPGAVITATTPITVLSTGNLDAVEAVAEPVDGLSTQPIALGRLGDNRYQLDIRTLQTGTYLLKATGYSQYADAKGQHKDPVIAVTVPFSVKR